MAADGVKDDGCAREFDVTGEVGFGFEACDIEGCDEEGEGEMEGGSDGGPRKGRV